MSRHKPGSCRNIKVQPMDLLPDTTTALCAGSVDDLLSASEHNAVTNLKPKTEPIAKIQSNPLRLEDFHDDDFEQLSAGHIALAFDKSNPFENGQKHLLKEQDDIVLDDFDENDDGNDDNNDTQPASRHEAKNQVLQMRKPLLEDDIAVEELENASDDDNDDACEDSDGAGPQVEDRHDVVLTRVQAFPKASTTWNGQWAGDVNSLNTFLHSDSWVPNKVAATYDDVQAMVHKSEFVGSDTQQNKAFDGTTLTQKLLTHKSQLKTSAQKYARKSTAKLGPDVFQLNHDDTALGQCSDGLAVTVLGESSEISPELTTSKHEKSTDFERVRFSEERNGTFKTKAKRQTIQEEDVIKNENTNAAAYITEAIPHLFPIVCAQKTDHKEGSTVDDADTVIEEEERHTDDEPEPVDPKQKTHNYSVPLTTQTDVDDRHNDLAIKYIDIKSIIKQYQEEIMRLKKGLDMNDLLALEIPVEMSCTPKQKIRYLNIKIQTLKDDKKAVKKEKNELIKDRKVAGKKKAKIGSEHTLDDTVSPIASNFNPALSATDEPMPQLDSKERKTQAQSPSDVTTSLGLIELANPIIARAKRSYSILNRALTPPRMLKSKCTIPQQSSPHDDLDHAARQRLEQWDDDDEDSVDLMAKLVRKSRKKFTVCLPTRIAPTPLVPDHGNVRALTYSAGGDAKTASAQAASKCAASALVPAGSSKQ